MALTHTFVSAKTDGADATLVQKTAWNADHVVDTDGLKIVADATVPSAPAAGFAQVFGKTVAGASMLSTLDPAGIEWAMQPHIGRQRIGWWTSIGSGTTPQNSGMLAATLNGTTTARVSASTNLLTSTRRTGFVSTASAGNFAGMRHTNPQNLRGASAGVGGFTFVARWGCSDAATVSGARTFVGLAANSVGSVDPSSVVNIIGVGTDAGDANLQIITNDGSGTATKTNLGANFPDHTLSMDLYELILYCPPNASAIGYQVTRLNTGDVATGSITSDLPVNTTFLGPQIMRNNGATALAVGIDFVNLYIGTEA